MSFDSEDQFDAMIATLPDPVRVEAAFTRGDEIKRLCHARDLRDAAQRCLDTAERQFQTLLKQLVP